MQYFPVNGNEYDWIRNGETKKKHGLLIFRLGNPYGGRGDDERGWTPFERG